MTKRYLLAGLLILLSTSPHASPLFDARTEAKFFENRIEVSAVIANHSHRSACFIMVNQGSYLIRYKDGSTSAGVVNSEPSWRYGVPPPPPVQIVPADDKPYRYFWLDIPNFSYKQGEEPLVEVNVELHDCRMYFLEKYKAPREVFKATLATPIKQ